jgi:hypothetical protein
MIAAAIAMKKARIDDDASPHIRILVLRASGVNFTRLSTKRF